MLSRNVIVASPGSQPALHANPSRDACFHCFMLPLRGGYSPCNVSFHDVRERCPISAMFCSVEQADFLHLFRDVVQASVGETNADCITSTSSKPAESFGVWGTGTCQRRDVGVEAREPSSETVSSTGGDVTMTVATEGTATAAGPPLIPALVSSGDRRTVLLFLR